MAINLTTPLSESRSTSKVKVKQFIWEKFGNQMRLRVAYTDGTGTDWSSFDGFSRADCRSLLNRLETRMMNYPQFAGTQGDDPDET